ncbi:MAG: DUF2066 domain-containing protein [Pseudomonadales bacterium]|nr:DUF2066 domain-containing protein [Pseudomonadales bacterium]
MKSCLIFPACFSVLRPALIPGLLLMLLCPWFAQALPVEGLYRHELPVENQSNSERQRAYTEALAAVVLKLTGESRWLEHEAVRRALGNAGNFVQEVSFRSAGQSYITVSFSASQIDAMLIDAGIPIWDRNRPSVLIWLTIQDANGQRSILGSDSEHELIDIIQDFSRQRGIPLLLPMLDLVDRRNLPVDLAWSLDENAIREASARYGADSILSGRLLITPAGELVGLWQFQFLAQIDRFDSLDRDMSSYMQMPLERITTQLASHFGIIRSPGRMLETVNLQVQGVATLAAYAQMLDYLKGLAVVNEVSLKQLQGDEVELELKLWADNVKLIEFLSLDRDLQAMPALNTDLRGRGTGGLRYRWTR